MTAASAPSSPLRAQASRAFSLIELVIVIMIIGALATIAIPRMVNAADRSGSAALAADRTNLQHAIDLYTAEHLDRCPATDSSGVLSTDSTDFLKRLLGKTKISGEIDQNGIWGPYLREFPANPKNAKATVRIDGASAGANTHGWRYDSLTRSIQPDQSTGGGVAEGVEGVGGGTITQGAGHLAGVH